MQNGNKCFFVLCFIYLRISHVWSWFDVYRWLTISKLFGLAICFCSGHKISPCPCTLAWIEAGRASITPYRKQNRANMNVADVLSDNVTTWFRIKSMTQRRISNAKSWLWSRGRSWGYYCYLRLIPYMHAQNTDTSMKTDLGCVLWWSAAFQSRLLPPLLWSQLVF